MTFSPLPTTFEQALSEVKYSRERHKIQDRAIKSLQQQLAHSEMAATAEAKYANGLKQELAECQAREKVRIEALKAADECIQFYSHPGSKLAAEALGLPFDSTALDAAIKQAKREARRSGLLEAASVAEEYEDRNVFGSAAWIRRMAEVLK